MSDSVRTKILSKFYKVPRNKKPNLYLIMSENHIPKNSDITYGRSLYAIESVIKDTCAHYTIIKVVLFL